MRQWHFSAYLTIALWCGVLTVLTHCPMLFKIHYEGDEVAYFVLAERMGWDGSNYTTKDDPRIRNFPYSIYHGPLFHHPPLYPYLLKVAMEWKSNPLLMLPYVATRKPIEGELSPIVQGEAVAGIFLVSVFITLSGVIYAWRLMVLTKIEPIWGVTAMVGVVFCPLLLFSTVRIHHDGLAGLMVLCGLVAFAETLTVPRLRTSIEAAAWLVLALNIRFNTILVLPIIAAMPLYSFWAKREHAARATFANFCKHFRAKEYRLGPALVFGAVLTLGLQHYYRLWATYGTVWPGTLIRPLENAANYSQYLTWIETKMTRAWVLADLGMFFPLLLLFIAPWNLKAVVADLRTGKWSAAFVAIFMCLFLGQFALSYIHVRYFAAVTPLMHVCWPYLLRNAPAYDWCRWSLGGLAGLTLVLMLTTGFLVSAIEEPHQVILRPSLAVYLAPMLESYDPTHTPR